ncbi:NAD-dependent malic enzyme 2, mitochondrial [Gossypium hirsutum]|uniref:NAD-dependent malic enzyme 2, mitochondrial n=1 Tax=Gossypium hirsutum TaxID=3635 RepID=A0A1U8P716_GOSHI|nr:NAD-dependent malic enzyme 2, mitochondrial-like [Gossypium hirsutum]
MLVGTLFYLPIVEISFDMFLFGGLDRFRTKTTKFEDFQMKWAFKTLKRYRERFCMFNDDVQGTAGVALAGLLGTVRAQGRSLDDFPNHKIVVVGAGRCLADS